MECTSLSVLWPFVLLIPVLEFADSWIVVGQTIHTASTACRSTQQERLRQTSLDALNRDYLPYYPHSQYGRNPEELAAAINDLGWHIMKFRNARLQALQDLSESLRLLISIQDELVTHSTIIQPQTIQQVASQAVEQIDRLEEAQNELLVGLSQATAATSVGNFPHSSEATHSLDNELLTLSQSVMDTSVNVRDELHQFMDAEEKQEQSIKSRVSTNAAKYYKYTGKLLTPNATPGLPNVAGDTLLTNIKLSQPMITSQFDQLLASLSKNQPMLVTLKKNQPVLAAELDSILLQLKKNAPLWTDDLSQLIVDVKQLLLVLLSGAGGGGIM